MGSLETFAIISLVFLYFYGFFGKRCNGWNEIYMSEAAKEVNVKDVADDIHNFKMVLFKIK